MKLLLSAFIGSDNLGDEAIAEIIIRKLEAVASGLVVLTRNEARTQRLTRAGHSRAVRFTPRNFFREARRADCLLLGGGGIINDESSILSLLKYYLQVFVARRLLGRRVVLVWVGAGPVNSRVGHWLVRDITRMVSYALVRDEGSADLLQAHGLPSDKIDVAYDIVFNFPLSDLPPQSAPQPYILFCPRDWFFLKKSVPTRLALKRARSDPASGLFAFRRQLLQLLERVFDDQPQLHIVGVPFYFSQDLDQLHWLADRLPPVYRRRFTVHETELLPEQYVALATKAQAVLGVRLHSLILAAVAKRPLVPLTYSSKVKSIAHQLHLEEFVISLDSPEFAIEPAMAAVRQAVSTKSPDYADAITSIRRRNEEIFRRLVAVLQKV